MNWSLSASLAPDVHFAWPGNDVVILDVSEDRYLCLVDGAEMVQPGSTPGTVLMRDAGVAEGMIAAGLTGSSLRHARTPIVLPREALAPIDPSLSTCLGAVANAVSSTVTFKRSDLKTLINAVQTWRRSRARPDLSAASASLGAFGAILPWMPFEEDCLQRAFMLRHHLHTCGIAATWVFGVRTWPFLAHCWVQIDDIVVGDSLERVGGFTPILAV